MRRPSKTKRRRRKPLVESAALADVPDRLPGAAGEPMRCDLYSAPRTWSVIG